MISNSTKLLKFALHTAKSPARPPSHSMAGDTLFSEKESLMKKLRFLSTVTVISLCLSSPAKAGGIPVIDVVSVGHAVTQLNEMAKDYQTQLEQLDQALSTYNSLTGGRNIGDLLNSSAEQDLRRALPADLQDMIGLNNAGGLGSSGLQTQGIYNDLLTSYNPITGADLFTSDPTGTLASAHDRHKDTTVAALAASESAYNTASQRLSDYEALLGELNSSPDLKASVDLLARISVENGILMNELIKMQALQMQLNASQQGQIITETRRISNAQTYNENTAATAAFQTTP